MAARGVASRRVCVNGRAASLGDSADPARDRILLDGRPLPEQDAPVTLMLYKPRGYVTTLHDELGRKTAAQLVDCGCRVYPVGRLDCASEGLLLFTNDGALADRLMHPRGCVEKTYEVTVSGADARPIVLDGRPINPPTVRLLRQSERKTTYEITISEGRNRQIRRMCEEAGVRVLRLCRVREGNLTLGDLGVGKWRYLTAEELTELKKEAGLR